MSFSDGALACQDEAWLRQRGPCRTTDILHLWPLRSPNSFNDFFFFFKYVSWLPQGRCQEP